MTAIVTAEAAATEPSWLQKFKTIPVGQIGPNSDLNIFLADMKRCGHTHYLTVFQEQKTATSPIDGEYSPFNAAIFFKQEPRFGDPSDFIRFLSEQVSEPVPIMENRIYYTKIHGVGAGTALAELQPVEVAEWLAFFEFTLGPVRSTKNL